MNGPVKIIVNPWLRITLLVVLLQQVLVAGGTYFLGKLTSEFPSEGFNWVSALILFICISLPGTLVHYWVVWGTVRANKRAQWNYLNQYMHTNYNQPTHWRNTASKQQRHDIMSRGGQEAIQSAIHFFVDASATGLNILLNTISIILVTDLLLGVVITIAGIIGLLIIHFSEKRISIASRDEILADGRLNAHLYRSWDNVILGNQTFFQQWSTYFAKYFAVTEAASLNTVRKRDSAVALAGIVTNGIVLGSALYMVWMHQNATTLALAILVMLPRCLQVVMHIQIIQTYLAQWKGLQEKLIVTQESFSAVEPVDLTPLIQEHQITLKEGSKQHTISEIENIASKRTSGRFTITGPNGAGKSSLLLKLKSMNASAVYLPAQHQLMLEDASSTLSSGETALAALEYLRKEPHTTLLLDEWDANLSPENRMAMDKMIDQLSADRLIIEVRHGHFSTP
jgi:ABC-type transport system involved in cytochrome bd biosynthesis fused ATPase/permease subunit